MKMIKVDLELSKFHIDCESEMEKLNYSGIYFVILGYTTDKKKSELKEIIYIGESANISKRFETHNKRKKWFEKAIEDNGQLFFYAARVEQEKIREDTEKALIYHFKPCCNDEGKDSFDKEETEITIYGEYRRIITSFTVKPTNH
jgi:predicted GIY-YIG superfamily endonuclease